MRRLGKIRIWESEAQKTAARLNATEWRPAWISCVILTVCAVLWAWDPFNWMGDIPEERPARQMILAGTYMLLVWGVFAWFMLVMPLKNGAVFESNRYGPEPGRWILRSDKPAHFRFVYRWNALFVWAFLAGSLYVLIGGVKDFSKREKAAGQPRPSQSTPQK